MKRKNLELLKSGRPPFSYRPVRRCFGDIFNLQPELFGPADPTPWEVIERQLDKRCCSATELEHNKRVGKGLHEFAMSSRIMGRKHEFFPLAVGMGRKVTFWLPMILAFDEHPHAVFIEPRRKWGLNAEGRRFAFSVMHERIRAADEDFKHVRLAIIRFADPEGERRAVRLYTDEGIDLYPIDELQTMVASTYDIWLEILEGHEARREPASHLELK